MHLWTIYEETTVPMGFCNKKTMLRVYLRFVYFAETENLLLKVFEQNNLKASWLFLVESTVVELNEIERNPQTSLLRFKISQYFTKAQNNTKKNIEIQKPLGHSMKRQGPSSWMGKHWTLWNIERRSLAQLLREKITGESREKTEPRYLGIPRSLESLGYAARPGWD